MSYGMSGRHGKGGLAVAGLLAATLAIPGLAAAELDAWEGDPTQAEGLVDQGHQRRAVVVRGRPAAVVVRRPAYRARFGPFVFAPLWRPRALVIRGW
jgi:hypothetical protein